MSSCFDYHNKAQVREWPCRQQRAIIDVNSIVSGGNYDLLTLIIAQLLTSWPLLDLCHNIQCTNPGSGLTTSRKYEVYHEYVEKVNKHQSQQNMLV